MNRSAIDRTEAERALKATTKVRRYSASGAIQNSGTGAMSVEKYVVTASIRLDGMNASAIHVPRRSHVGAAAAGLVAVGVAETARRRGPPAPCAASRRRPQRHAASTNTP